MCVVPAMTLAIEWFTPIRQYAICPALPTTRQRLNALLYASLHASAFRIYRIRWIMKFLASRIETVLYVPFATATS